MKRLLLGMVPTLVLLAGVGCSGDPTGDLQNGVDHLTATPNQMFIELGASKTVLVSGFDAQGNPQSLDYEVTDPGTGITVTRDTTFRPDFVNDSTLEVPATSPTFRFIVTSSAYTATKFTVSAGGKSVDVAVQVVPQAQIAATLSEETALLGDTVTITAAAGTSFDAASKIFFGGDTNRVATVTERDPGGQFIKFIPPPSVAGPVGITLVTSVSAPTLKFSPQTVVTLTTPLVDTVNVSYSTAAPAIGSTETMTIVQDPTHIKFAAVDSILYPGQLTGPSPGPQAITVAADSNSLTFQTPPNINGNGLVTSFHFPGDYILALPTRPVLTAPNIGTTLDATFSDSTPALLDPVTVTLPAGFQVSTDPAAVAVAFGSGVATVNSIGGGGTTIDVTPAPGSSGTAVITGLFQPATPQFVFTMSSIHTMSVPNITPLVGTDNPATAPTVDAVAGTVLADLGSFGFPDCVAADAPCQVYRLHVASASTLQYTLQGANKADLGLYFLDPTTLAVLPQACDGLGRDSPPESCSLTFAAGDYIMSVVNFGPLYPELDPNPAFIVIKIQ
jgi:hypothetical protein